MGWESNVSVDKSLAQLRSLGVASRLIPRLISRTWLDRHWDDPVPTHEEKTGFAERHGITTKQVTVWESFVISWAVLASVEVRQRASARFACIV